MLPNLVQLTFYCGLVAIIVVQVWIVSHAWLNLSDLLRLIEAIILDTIFQTFCALILRNLSVLILRIILFWHHLSWLVWFSISFWMSFSLEIDLSPRHIWLVAWMNSRLKLCCNLGKLHLFAFLLIRELLKFRLVFHVDICYVSLVFLR